MPLFMSDEELAQLNQHSNAASRVAQRADQYIRMLTNELECVRARAVEVSIMAEQGERAVRFLLEDHLQELQQSNKTLEVSLAKCKSKEGKKMKSNDLSLEIQRSVVSGFSRSRSGVDSCHDHFQPELKKAPKYKLKEKKMKGLSLEMNKLSLEKPKSNEKTEPKASSSSTPCTCSKTSQCKSAGRQKGCSCFIARRLCGDSCSCNRRICQNNK